MDYNAYMNLIGSQARLPWTLFFITFFVLMLLEAKFNAYKEKTPRSLRWPNNILLAVLNAIILRLVLPGFLLWSARTAYGHNFGVMNQLKVQDLVGIIMTILFLDWVLYYFHRALHALPWLWKFHRVHHSDPDVDVTTGVRFHTGEVILTTLVKSAFIFILGAPIYGVFCFEIIVALFTLYDHSNTRMPALVEKGVRLVFLTPFMHRVHHSKESLERNSNYGFIFSIWDRFLGTYKNPEKVGLTTLGLNDFQMVQFLRLKNLLLQPFLDTEGHFNWKNFTKDV